MPKHLTTKHNKNDQRSYSKNMNYKSRQTSNVSTVQNLLYCGQYSKWHKALQAEILSLCEEDIVNRLNMFEQIIANNFHFTASNRDHWIAINCDAKMISKTTRTRQGIDEQGAAKKNYLTTKLKFKHVAKKNLSQNRPKLWGNNILPDVVDEIIEFCEENDIDFLSKWKEICEAKVKEFFKQCRKVPLILNSLFTKKTKFLDKLENILGENGCVMWTQKVEAINANKKPGARDTTKKVREEYIDCLVYVMEQPDEDSTNLSVEHPFSSSSDASHDNAIIEDGNEMPMIAECAVFSTALPLPPPIHTCYVNNTSYNNPMGQCHANYMHQQRMYHPHLVYFPSTPRYFQQSEQTLPSNHFVVKQEEKNEISTTVHVPTGNDYHAEDVLSSPRAYSPSLDMEFLNMNSMNPSMIPINFLNLQEESNYFSDNQYF